MMERLAYLCAAHSFLFVVFHLFFWRIFRWKEELADVSISTRAIIQILNVQLIVVFSLTGYLCLTYPRELMTTALGRSFLGGMAVFWFVRFIQQYVFLRYHRWSLHLLSLFFFIGFLLFLTAAGVC